MTQPRPSEVNGKQWLYELTYAAEKSLLLQTISATKPPRTAIKQTPGSSPERRRFEASLKLQTTKDQIGAYLLSKQVTVIQHAETAPSPIVTKGTLTSFDPATGTLTIQNENGYNTMPYVEATHVQGSDDLNVKPTIELETEQPYRH